MTDAFPPTDDRGIVGVALSLGFAEDGIGFAASARGLLVTRDGAASWESAFASVPEAEELPTTAVACSLEMGVDGFVIVAIPGGIGRSDDGGRSWEFVALPLPAPLVTALLILTGAGGSSVVIAATDQDGILRSEDEGRTWSPWNAGLSDHTVLSLVASPHVAHDGLLFAGTASGLFRSVNAGRSWQPMQGGPEFPTILSLIVVGDAMGECLYLLVGSEEHGLLESPDSGVTWRAVDSAHGLGIYAVHALVAAGGSIMALGDDAIGVSHDSGQTWKILTDLPVERSTVTTIALTQSGENCVIGTSSGAMFRIPSR